MNFKKLFACAAIVLGCGSMWAQTKTDVTDKITNPSFEANEAVVKKSNLTAACTDITGWTITTTNTGFNNEEVLDANTDNSSGFGKRVTPKDGTYYFFARQGWFGNNVNITMQTTTAELAAGEYELTVDYMATENSTAQDKLKFSVSQTEELGSTEYDFARSKATDYFSSGNNWQEGKVTFTVATAGTVTIEVKAILNGNNSPRADFILDNFKLSKVEGADVSALDAKITAVQAVVDNSTGDKTAINEAITTATGVKNNPTTQAAVDQAVTDLNTAYETYVLAAVPNSGYTFDYTFEVGDIYNTGSWTSTTGAQNTVWKYSTGKNTDDYQAAGFYENWKGSAYDGKLYHTFEGLRAGVYNVTALAFANTGDGTANVYCNKATADLSGETDKFQQITVEGVVVKDGNLEVGLQVTGKTWVGISTINLAFVRELTEDDAILDKIQEIIDLATSTTIPSDEAVGDDVFQYDASLVNIAKANVKEYQGYSAEQIAAGLKASDAYKGTNYYNLTYLNSLYAGMQNGIKAMNTLNAPEEDRTYRIYLKENDTWTYSGNAITSCPGERTDMGNYNLKYKPSTNNFQQAMYFEAVEVEGKQNTYKIKFDDAEGNERYICTGVSYGGYATQIRTTLNDEDALVIEVRRNGDYIQLYNTEANQFIGSQDEGVFTVGSHNDFEIHTCNWYSSADVSLARKYATVVLPHNSDKPQKIDKIYNVTGLEEDGKTLVLEEVESFEASKAYLVEIKEIEDEGSITINGIPVAYKQPEANGLLKGTFLNIMAPAGSYVLQTQNDVQMFYKVAEGQQPWLYANKAYLELPADSNAKSLSIGTSEETAIKTIDALVSGEAKIYDINGRELKSLQKGVNIVNGVKVMVK